MKCPISAYCFDDPPDVTNAVRTYTTTINNVGQIANHVCKANHEWVDQLALDALATGDASDDQVITQRQRECQAGAVTLGGQWVDLQVMPDKCYCKGLEVIFFVLKRPMLLCFVLVINCTESIPPAASANFTRTVTKNSNSASTTVLPDGSLPLGFGSQLT